MGRQSVELNHAATAARPSGQRRSSKRSEKKHDIALHALAALAEIGFARINQREIAARSGVALGVIHYYFEDKNELMIHCVGLYNDAFVVRCDETIATADSVTTLQAQYIGKMVIALENHAHAHRLWYDARAQALFDETFRPVVDDFELRMVGNIHHFFDRLVALGGKPEITGCIDALKNYLAVDRWFRYCLQQKMSGDAQATTLLRQRLEVILR